MFRLKFFNKRKSTKTYESGSREFIILIIILFAYCTDMKKLYVYIYIYAELMQLHTPSNNLFYILFLLEGEEISYVMFEQ